MSVGRLAAQLAVNFVVFAFLLFLPAGTVAWPAGWAFLALYFGFGAALCAWLLRHDPALLAERMSGVGRPDQPAWDKAFVASSIALFAVWLVVAPLDAVRFRWSHVPRWVQATGAVVLVASFWLLFVTFRENSYLSPAVRVQADRGQRVVSTGPYAYVRHPMYAALALLLFGATLLLGSWWGLVPAAALVAATAYRAVREERALAAELPGYTTYTATVRYRLVPRVW